MADIRPFKGLRPRVNLVEKVAALPYDVSTDDEVKAKRINPYSFYHITRSEIDINTGDLIHSKEVYQKASENLNRFIEEKTLVQDTQAYYYIYMLTMNGRSQTGLVCCSSLKDYENGIIKKHEFTQPVRVLDRVDNIVATRAHTGLVFLAYKELDTISEIIENWKSNQEAIYNFTSEDGIAHQLWVLDDNKTIEAITEIFQTKVPNTYIADGHHRSEAAYLAQEKLSGSNKDYYLTCIFPDTEVFIMDYNRTVKDLNGLDETTFLESLKSQFEVTLSDHPYAPKKEHEFGMYLNGNWYMLFAKENSYNSDDSIDVLDVSILQNNLLTPILDIDDPRTNERIDFIGGIKGLKGLEDEVDSGRAAVAFSCFPATMNQLFDVADKGKVMPPKSTWFEPKTRDGLVLHLID
ncbi:MAG TPA: DUF1015 family protein [Edaphocola sp.]|nr:DUF1015 family protein [Edaphocola sp.]